LSASDARPKQAVPESDADARLRVAGVAHDVNQMLAVIRGRAELLLRRLPGEQSHLQAIALAARDASAMLERLGGDGVTPDGAGAASSPRQALDDAALLVLPPSGAWADGSSGRGDGAWVLDNRLAAALAVRVPAPVLREVLVNLLRNAVGAMPEGGRVVADAQAGDDFVRVRLADDGPGIAPAVAQTLFEAGATTNRGAGHGIGLAACRQLLAAHGATLELGVGEARGATFLIGAARAAASAVGAASIAGPAAAAGPGLASLPVVVIDDEAAMRGMLQDVLGELGCRVCCHRDGAAALADDRTAGAAVALVDRRLPGQDGLEVAARLRERDGRLVIVLMSGWDRDELPAPDGLVDFTVRKPLGLDNLQDLLSRAAALHQQRARQELGS
jgi:CheY-like chemotaxis protein